MLFRLRWVASVYGSQFCEWSCRDRPGYPIRFRRIRANWEICDRSPSCLLMCLRSFTHCPPPAHEQNTLLNATPPQIHGQICRFSTKSSGTHRIRPCCKFVLYHWSPARSLLLAITLFGLLHRAADSFVFGRVLPFYRCTKRG